MQSDLKGFNWFFLGYNAFFFNTPVLRRIFRKFRQELCPLQSERYCENVNTWTAVIFEYRPDCGRYS